MATVFAFLSLFLALLALRPAHAAPIDCPPAAAAEAPSAQALARMAREATEHGVLWRMERQGRVSYLYGTLHVGRREWAMPGPSLRAALAATDVLAMELDLLDPATLQALQQGLAQAQRPVLPEPLAQRLARQITQSCAPAGSLDGLHPVMQVTTLTLLEALRDGLDGGYGQETVLAGFAHARHRPIVALETAAEQLAVMLPATDEEAVTAVEDGLSQLERGVARALMRRLANAWAEGRLDELERYAEWCECTDTPEQRAQLARELDGRNAQMAQRIDALHRSGRQVLAAVGTLHMTGEQGLPRLMRSLGYRVERVMPAGATTHRATR
ncbi:TraB/GumN family protein [Ideonella sp. BN130291]|uniref:TraB/GumN family protein n=1 Tax=Ideonella sp. BN130291 TaxID=3112940 RepID=UPI002E2574FA|nr:TraB/GumN family protein [Ideonella sp. BN130291]